MDGPGPGGSARYRAPGAVSPTAALGADALGADALGADALRHVAGFLCAMDASRLRASCRAAMAAIAPRAVPVSDACASVEGLAWALDHGGLAAGPDLLSAAARAGAPTDVLMFAAAASCEAVRELAREGAQGAAEACRSIERAVHDAACLALRRHPDPSAVAALLEDCERSGVWRLAVALCDGDAPRRLARAAVSGPGGPSNLGWLSDAGLIDAASALAASCEAASMACLRAALLSAGSNGLRPNASGAIVAASRAACPEVTACLLTAVLCGEAFLDAGDQEAIDAVAALLFD